MNASVHFLAPELTKWDAATADALALSLFSDERPLRGAAGLCDWRLAGRISRLLRAGRLSGARGETLMLPPAGRRLPFPRIFLFGLGETEGFGERRYRDAVRRIRRVLDRAAIRRYALQPPGRAMGLIAPRRALDIFLDEAREDGFPAEVTIIESSGGQKEMAESLRGGGRRPG
jgi:hypothetical protein